MSLVKSFVRRQADVSQQFQSSREKQNQSSPQVERPLSEYDNLQTITTNSSSSKPALQTHFPLADIKFRFDDLQTANTTAAMSSSTRNSNNNNNISAIIKPHYENVIDTVQMRNKRESDQRQVMDQSDGHLPRPAISEAKSSFFGLNHPENEGGRNDDLEKLIEDCANIKIITNDVQYVNLPNDNDDVNKISVSATSSASGSSSITATPSASPTRETRTCSRKDSVGSNRSKSPRFLIPSPSQVS